MNKNAALLVILLAGACGEIDAADSLDIKRSALIYYDWISSGKVVIRASNGQYFTAEGGGGGDVNANRNAIGDWETFNLYVDRKNRSRWSFRTYTGHYLSAEGGGGGSLRADRTAAHEWEAFLVIPTYGGFALQTYNGHYVVAEDGGGREVNAASSPLYSLSRNTSKSLISSNDGSELWYFVDQLPYDCERWNISLKGNFTAGDAAFPGEGKTWPAGWL